MEKVREVIDSRKQLLFLPEFAAFIIDNHLEEFLRYSRTMLRTLDVPLIRRMSIEEGDNLANRSNTELLTSLANRNPSEHIQSAIDRWRTSQFPRVQRNHFVVEDVTRIAHVRKISFLKVIPEFTSEPEKILSLVAEIDAYILEYTATTLHSFVGIIDDRMHEQVERLEASEQLYKNAERVTHIGNWKWTVSENNVQWTDELYRIFGLEPQSRVVTLEIYMEFIHPDDRENVMNRITHTMSTREPFDFFHRIVANGGQIKFIHSLGEASINEAGEVYQLIGSAQDVTVVKEAERKVSEQQEILERRTRELQESNASLEEFAYVASHDLKEQLRKISIFIGLLGDSVQWPGPKEKGWYDRIVASASRMRTLIEDLLALSLLSAEKKPAPYNLHEIFSQTLQIFERTIEETKAVVTCTALPVAPVIPSQFGQLFQNLISNALKFARVGVSPKIHVTHRFIEPTEAAAKYKLAPRAHLEIQVSDNGIGFENSYDDKIFTVFQRLHNKDEYEGTGIGLAICKKIAKNHEGIITASGEPGKGATFVVVIPTLTPAPLPGERG